MAATEKGFIMNKKSVIKGGDLIKRWPRESWRCLADHKV